MPSFNKLLAGRATTVSTSRTVTGATNVAASDLNNEIVFNSSSAANITLPASNGLGATIDDAVYVYVAGTGIPAFVWTGGTIRVPSTVPTPVQYSYMVVKWSPAGEWVRV
jgi:hypothetical protein